MRCSKWLLALASAVLAGPAFPQSLGDTTYSGNWSIRQADSKKLVPVTVEIRGFDGTWLGPIERKDSARPGAACPRRRFPITIQESNINQLEFTVWGQAMDKDCPNLSFTFKPAGKNQFEGTSAALGAVELALKPSVQNRH